MPSIKINAPDGKSLLIHVPEGTQPDQFKQLAQSALAHYTSQTKGPDIQQLQKEDQPVQDISVTEALDAPFKVAQAAGEFGAEAAAQHGMNPTLAAGLGTGVAMIPHTIAAAQLPVKAAAGALEGGLSTIGNKIGGIVNTLKGPTMEEAKAMGQAAEGAFQPEAAQKAAQYTKQLVEPVQGRIRSFGQRLANLPGQTMEKTKILEAGLKEKGAAMGAAEDAAGFGFKSGPEFEAALKNPKTMGKALKAAEDFAKMGPNKVAETVDPKTIQLVRKLAQEGKENVSNLGSATLAQGREVASNALGLIDKKFGQARSEYQEVKSAIDALPLDQKRMASMLKSQLQEAKSMLAEAQSQAKELAQAAKTADKARFADIQQESLHLLRKGIEHDQMIRKIKVAAGSIGAAIVGKHYYKGM